MTPLHCAVVSLQSECVRTLLEVEGIDVNIKNNYSMNLLHCASRNVNLECVKLLLEVTNVDVNLKDNVGFKSLALAKSSDKQQICDLLYRAWCHIRENFFTHLFHIIIYSS